MRRSLVSRVWGPGGVRLLLGDAAVLVVLAAIVVAFAAPRGSAGPRAEVLVGGQPGANIDLARDGVHEILGPLGVTRLEVRDGRLRVLSSPCPRQVCRHGGWIGEPGRLLVCLPNRVVVRIPGEPLDNPDARSR